VKSPPRDEDVAIALYDAPASLARRGLALAIELVHSDAAKIRVVIVDDIPVTRYLLAKLISYEPDMEVVGLAGDGIEAVLTAERERPDVILMDINMPCMDGITATELISAAVPASAVIMASVQGEQSYLRRAMLAGAVEYIVEPASADEFINAIRHVSEWRRIHHKEHGPTVAASLDGYRVSTEATERPCDLLLKKSELPSGFECWYDGGSTSDYLDRSSRYCWRVFANGEQPATVSPVLWSQVWFCRSARSAAKKFDVLTEQVDGDWSYGSSHAQSISGLARWPHAAQFSPLSTSQKSLGDQFCLKEATRFGRKSVWAYLRVGRVLWGLVSEDVPSSDIERLARACFGRSLSAI
jgi:DNA-binding NarL/FixJ family response regulator